MTPAETAIARELAHHPEWRWLPGMWVYELDAAEPVLLVEGHLDGECWAYCDIEREGYPMTPHLPALDHPATRGILLEAACQRWGDHGLYLAHDRGSYSELRHVPPVGLPPCATTEGEYLAAAWLEAP